MFSVLNADIRLDQKTKFQLGGALGRIVNIFGGRAARDGVTSTVAIKGPRRVTTTDTTSQIVDLAEEKVYDLDLKKKNYKVTTFAELRRQFEEAQRKAQEEAKKAQAQAPATEQKTAEKDPDAKEYEVDFDVKNTNERKTLNGFNTHQVIVTITVREKGQTLAQGGGLVMTTDMWLAPKNPAMNELGEFERKYAEKVYGSMRMGGGASPQDMATALAMYPQLKPAMAKMEANGASTDGTPILTTVTVDAVKSQEEMAQDARDNSNAGSSAPPTSVGGLLGGLARQRMQNNSKNEAANDRANVFTSSTEVLKLAADVTADVVAVPAGFKESK
jgi:hypothetical protein